MFSLLKGLISSILPGVAADPVKEKNRKKRKKTPDEPRKSEFAVKVAPPKKARESKPAKPREKYTDLPAVAPAAVPPPVSRSRKKPERPAELKEVPPMEGRMRFLDLDLPEEIQFALQNLDFEYCTPIQAMSLPRLLEGRDLAGKAQTGTGKTAAFLVAAFTRLLRNPVENRADGQCRVLILAPTRELAIQIFNDAEAISLFTDMHNVVVFGGMDHEKQRRELGRPVDILVGTPGRIIDFARSGDLKLGKAEILVIDEADRMLDMGFIPDVRRIVSQLPHNKSRHTMLFSATLEESILRLTSNWLTDPITVESEPEKLVGEGIEQIFYTVTRDEKLPLLLHMLKTVDFERMMIFGNRKDVNSRLQADLEKCGYSVPLLSGDIPQDKRIKILDRFRSGEEKIVIATDVAARGIHVDDVSIVVNYDLPERAEDYVHRIGRTGRAGKSGKAISFLCEYGAYNLPAIEELLHTKFNSILPEEEDLVMPANFRRTPDVRRARTGSSTFRRPPRRKKW